MKIASVNDLHEMQDERRPAPVATPQPTTISLDKLVAAVVESANMNAAMVRSNTEAVIAVARGLGQERKVPVEIIRNDSNPVLRWEFTIERDEDGLTKKVIAEAK